MMQRAIWPAITCGLMIVSFAAGRTARSFNTLPDIAATLPGDQSEFSTELNDRIRAQFPVGSPEEDLIAYLANERFVPDWHRRDGPNSSSFVFNGLICTKIVQVNWRTDSAGVLTEISGSYESQCR